MRPLLSIVLATTLINGLLEEPADAGVQANSPELNGLSFNGLSFNGLSFNGLSFNGLSFNGLSFNGLSFNGPLLVGVVGGAGVDAFDLIGGTLTGTTTGGATVTLHIDDVQMSPDHPDVVHYWISVAVDKGWHPICDGGGPALAMPGEWMDCWGEGCGGRGENEDAFTFACSGSTIAKCAEDLGYKPWSNVSTCAPAKNGLPCLGVTIADYHEACVRMLRGDYCGNGMPTTQEGTQINVWDALPVPIQLRTSTVDWPLEAEWNPNGATCVSHVRWDTPLADAVLDLYGLPSGSRVSDYVEQVCVIDEQYAQHVSRCGFAGNRGGFFDQMLLANDSELLVDTFLE